MFEVNNLKSALVGLGASASDRLFETLHEAYGETGRHYHNSTHIAECLRNAQRYQHLAGSFSEIEVAIWFHDAVYDTKRGDNEEQSALWAERELSALGTHSVAISRVVEMILATKTHQSDHPDTHLMLDIDLCVLGAEKVVFEGYDRAIRKEFGWVPEEVYRLGRSKVLSSFLERSEIFKTTEIRERYEFQARENLRRKLTELGS